MSGPRPRVCVSELVTPSIRGLLLGPIGVLMPGPIRKLGGGLRRRRHGLRDEEERSGVHAVELW